MQWNADIVNILKQSDTRTLGSSFQISVRSCEDMQDSDVHANDLIDSIVHPEEEIMAVQCGTKACTYLASPALCNALAYAHKNNIFSQQKNTSNE